MAGKNEEGWISPMEAVEILMARGMSEEEAKEQLLEWLAAGKVRSTAKRMWVTPPKNGEQGVHVRGLRIARGDLGRGKLQ